MAASIYVSPFWPALLLRAPLGSPAQGFSPVPEHRRPTVPAALLVRQTRVRLGNQTAAVSVPRCRLWPRPTGLALPSALPPVGTSRAVLVPTASALRPVRSEEHTSELQSHSDLVCRLLLEKKKKKQYRFIHRASK